MTQVETITNWKKIKEIINEVLVTLQAVCTALPLGVPKTVCLAIVAILQVLVVTLPNELEPL